MMPSSVRWLVVLLCCPFFLRPMPAGAGESRPFPLSPGAWWVYEGTVKWTEAADQVKERVLSWKMEVVRVTESGPLEIAVMKGHPRDLCLYAPGVTRSDYLMVRDGDRYHLVEPPQTRPLEQLLADHAALSGLLTAENVILQFPLREGDSFGSGENERTDGLYRWTVQSAEEVRLTDIKGIADGTRGTQYKIVYRTLPDHQVVDFVPAIGMTSYLYKHHGTVAEVDVHLVEYHGP